VCDPATLRARHARVRERLDALGLERLLVTSLPNVAWLTGVFASAGSAVVEPDTVTLVIDRRYASDAADAVERAGGALDLALVEGSYDETLASVLDRRSTPAGFESRALTVDRHRWFLATLAHAGFTGDRLVPTADLIESCRIVKDAWEIAQLREGARRLSAVARRVLPGVRAGLREFEVASAIETAMRQEGFSRPAFDTIVASGPRSALPHGRASDRRLHDGELVVLDFGGVYGGYCVDLTRTLALGEPPRDAPRVFAAVAEARDAARAAAMPGVPLDAVDAAARQVLEGHGLAEAFTHGTGHGLGLEVHEAPRLAPRRPGWDRPPLPGTVRLPDAVEAGMVFTIEPGVYRPGWGGVRIEDDALVTGTGAEWLTDVPTALTTA
jgi:Xaa-Pro aminopeptidase